MRQTVPGPAPVREADDISRPIRLFQIISPAQRKVDEENSHRTPLFHTRKSMIHFKHLTSFQPSPPPPTLPLLQQLIPPFSYPSQKLCLLQKPTTILLSIRGELFRERGVTRGMRRPVVCGLTHVRRTRQRAVCGETGAEGEDVPFRSWSFSCPLRRRRGRRSLIRGFDVASVGAALWWVLLRPLSLWSVSLLRALRSMLRG